MALTWVSCSHCKVHFQTDDAGDASAKCRACGAALNAGGAPEQSQWYYARNRQKVGPVLLRQLQQLAASGQLAPEDMLLRAGTSRWVPAGSIEGLFIQPTTSHHPAPVSPDQSTTPERPSPSLARRISAAASELPTVAGHQVLEVLGRGGMGVVYKARHVRLKRLVALKMILAAEHAGEHEQARFRAEAEAVARLQHPNIVQIHEVGEQDGRPFFSLEFVDGGSLARKLAGAPLPAREAAQLIETLARAMHAAHQSGIVHRDLKPANVLLTAGGAPKIADFGLAKQLGDESGQTQTGAIMGTPSYMAPEQAAGRVKDVGPSADVYALGAILYETLTGRPPFRGVTALETLDQVLNREAVPPTQLQPACPRDLETICLKCLEKDPARRYASAGDLADDLARYLGDRPIQARPASLPYRFRKFTVRRKALVIGAATTLFMLIAGLIGTSIGMVQARLAKSAAEKADEKKTEALADAQRQLANFLAEKAGREAQRGNSEAALALYDQALEKGPDDEIAVQLGRLDCFGALGRTPAATALLDELANRPDLGRHRGTVLFLLARQALVREDSKETVMEQIRQALDAGLNEGDEAYARAMLATTIPEAIDHLKRSADKGRFDSGVMDMLVPLLLIVGRFDEAQDYLARSRIISPDSVTLTFQEALLWALKDDMKQANALLDRLGEKAPASTPRTRQLLRMVNKTASGEFQWEMTGLAPFLKELTGSEDLGEASKIGELKRVTQLPFARDLLKNWMAVSVASLTGRQQAKLDAMTKAVRIMPEGLSFLTYGQTLRTAGRLDEAEEMLRKAAVGQGVFNVRQRALYELIDLRLERQRTSGGKLDEAERRRLVADLRRMVALRPLPPEIADSSAAMFVMLGEPMLALQLIEDRSRRAEPSMETLHLRVMAEFELQAFPRVLATCQAILRRAPNDRLATDMRRMTQEAIKKLQGGGT